MTLSRLGFLGFGFRARGFVAGVPALSPGHEIFANPLCRQALHRCYKGVSKDETRSAESNGREHGT